MDNEQFLAVFDEANTRRLILLEQRKKQYGKGKDRLIQFKKMAMVESRLPSEIPFSLSDKQWTALADMVKTPEQYSLGQFRAVMDDVRNYMDLLEAVLIDTKE